MHNFEDPVYFIAYRYVGCEIARISCIAMGSNWHGWANSHKKLNIQAHFDTYLCIKIFKLNLPFVYG